MVEDHWWPMRLKLTGAQQQQLAKRATENSEAYQLYLNGLFYARKGGIEGFRKAIDYYSRALALDPRFALAHAENALIYNRTPPTMLSLIFDFVMKPIDITSTRTPGLTGLRQVIGGDHVNH